MTIPKIPDPDLGPVGDALCGLASLAVVGLGTWIYLKVTGKREEEAAAKARQKYKEKKQKEREERKQRGRGKKE